MSYLPNKLENYATVFAVTSSTLLPYSKAPKTQSITQSYLLEVPLVSTSSPTHTATTAFLDNSVPSSHFPPTLSRPILHPYSLSNLLKIQISSCNFLIETLKCCSISPWDKHQVLA